MEGVLLSLVLKCSTIGRFNLCVEFCFSDEHLLYIIVFFLLGWVRECKLNIQQIIMLVPFLESVLLSRAQSIKHSEGCLLNTNFVRKLPFQVQRVVKLTCEVRKMC